MISMNPQPPKLLGPIKNRKENTPIILGVSYINSPTKQLSIHLNTIFKNSINFKLCVKNLIELCKSLINRPINPLMC